MANKKFTKRALFGSVIALILCCAMLVGTTFAWFTDSASSGINKIESGNLDIVLQHARFNDGYNLTAWEDVTTDTTLFLNNKGEAILWEPGVHACEYFRIENAGNLALKFKISLIAENASEVNGKSLKDVLAGYGIFRNVENIQDNRFANLIDSRIPDPENTEFDVLKNGGFEYEAHLLPGEAIIIEAGAFWEPTDHDNDYNVKGGLTLDLGIELVATQYTYEYDSFENTYDKDAEYPEIEAPATSEPSDPTEGGNEDVITGEKTYGKDDAAPMFGYDNVIWFENKNFVDAKITVDETVSLVAFEGCTGNPSIILEADNTADLSNCEFTLEAGQKLLTDKSGAGTTQVLIHNVKVNGELLTKDNCAKWFSNVEHFNFY